MTRYFVDRASDGTVLAVATSAGSSYPGMAETDQTEYENALADLNGGA